MKRNLAAVAAVLLACVVLADVARALPPEPKDWEVQLKVYGWASALQTKVEAGGVESTIDESFFDILADLGWAVMGGGEGRYKRGLIMVDFLGMQIAADTDVGPRNFAFELPGGRDGNLSIGGIDSTTRITTWMVDTKFGFRALSMPLTKLTGSAEDPEDPRRLDFDLLAGARYWNFTTKVRVDVDPAQLTVGGSPVSLPGILPDLDFGNLKLPGVLLNGTRQWAQTTVDWADPLVGFRLSADVTRSLRLFMLGDIGGWGFGDASSLTWQGQLGGRWDFSEHWSAEGSYRAIGVNRNGVVAKTILYGPQFGVVYRF